MIKIINRIAVMLMMMLLSVNAFAGDNESSVEMATGLYQSGKIYVVVTVLSIIFIGIIGYLIMIDRKVSKLEKEIEKK
jgi:CcmD family protein